MLESHGDGNSLSHLGPPTDPKKPRVSPRLVGFFISAASGPDHSCFPRSGQGRRGQVVLGYPPLRNSFLNEVGKLAAALSLQTQKKSARRSERPLENPPPYVDGPFFGATSPLAGPWVTKAMLISLSLPSPAL